MRIRGGSPTLADRPSRYDDNSPHLLRRMSPSASMSSIPTCTKSPNALRHDVELPKLFSIYTRRDGPANLLVLCVRLNTFHGGFGDMTVMS